MLETYLLLHIKTHIQGYLLQFTQFAGRLDVRLRGEISDFPLDQSN